MRSTHTRMSSRIARSIVSSGSSRIATFGEPTQAAASTARRRWPIESSRIDRSATRVRPARSNASATGAAARMSSSDDVGFQVSANKQVIRARTRPAWRASFHPHIPPAVRAFQTYRSRVPVAKNRSDALPDLIDGRLVAERTAGSPTRIKGVERRGMCDGVLRRRLGRRRDLVRGPEERGHLVDFCLCPS